jgi:predicted small lipoprotein YifL
VYFFCNQEDAVSNPRLALPPADRAHIRKGPQDTRFSQAVGRWRLAKAFAADLLLLALAAGLAACGGSMSSGPAPTPTQTPSPVPTPDTRANALLSQMTQSEKLQWCRAE